MQKGFDGTLDPDEFLQKHMLRDKMTVFNLESRANNLLPEHLQQKLFEERCPKAAKGTQRMANGSPRAP